MTKIEEFFTERMLAVLFMKDTFIVYFILFVMFDYRFIELNIYQRFLDLFVINDYSYEVVHIRERHNYFLSLNIVTVVK